MCFGAEVILRRGIRKQPVDVPTYAWIYPTRIWREIVLGNVTKA